MADGDFGVEGLAQLGQQLLAFPDALAAKFMRGALRAGQKPILADAKQRAPEAPPSKEDAASWGSYPGALRDSLRVSTRYNRGTGLVTSTLIAGNKKAFYARWVEFGTMAHIIRAKNGKALNFNGREVYSVQHPGARKNPFMRNAIDSQVPHGIDAVVGYLLTVIGDKLFTQPDEVDG